MTETVEDNSEAEQAASTTLLTFLIADVRGYTRFTQQHGDAAATRLALRFAVLVHEELAGTGGELLGLRGDEAAVAFGSVREALRAALALQDRFAREMAADPTLPLRVGMGLDAGEAVPVEGGYRGGALNRAARLCSLAQPGEVLASGTTCGTVTGAGLGFEPRGVHSLKGVPGNWPVFSVLG